MIDGAIGVALDVNHFAVLHINVQAAAHSAIGTDTVKKLCISDTRGLFDTLDAEGLDPGAYLLHLRDGGLEYAGENRQECTFFHKTCPSIQEIRRPDKFALDLLIL